MDVPPTISGSDPRLLEFDSLIADIEEYRVFNEARESERREKFTTITNRIPPGREELLAPLMMIRLPGGFSREKSPTFGVERSLDRSRISLLSREREKSRPCAPNAMVDRIISPFTMKDISGRDDTLSAFDLRRAR